MHCLPRLVVIETLVGAPLLRLPLLERCHRRPDRRLRVVRRRLDRLHLADRITHHLSQLRARGVQDPVEAVRHLHAFRITVRARRGFDKLWLRPWRIQIAGSLCVWRLRR